jgi:hypothetical protein
MSGVGQTEKSGWATGKSVLTSITDFVSGHRHVSKVPTTELAAPQHEVDIDQCVNRGIGPELLAHLAQVEHMIGIGSGHFDRQRLPYVFHEHHFTAVGSAAL